MYKKKSTSVSFHLFCLLSFISPLKPSFYVTLRIFLSASPPPVNSVLFTPAAGDHYSLPQSR